jgi:ABC-type lipoprotein export system ATPase subunit
MFHELTIIPGRNKYGQPESPAPLTMKPGQLYAVVGHTGSGKSRLIQDLEQLACGDTVSGRHICIDGNIPERQARFHTSRQLIAHLSQNMRFVLDVTVEEFIRMHCTCRQRDWQTVLPEVIDQANTITPEHLHGSDSLNLLSGGQSRALMIADVAILCESPIVLIDEVENAGIHKEKSLHLLLKKQKLVLIATHDPHTALMSDCRICMKNGGIQSVIESNEKEQETWERLHAYQQYIVEMQRKMRVGELCVK